MALKQENFELLDVNTRNPTFHVKGEASAIYKVNPDGDSQQVATIDNTETVNEKESIFEGKWDGRPFRLRIAPAGGLSDEDEAQGFLRDAKLQFKQQDSEEFVMDSVWLLTV